MSKPVRNVLILSILLAIAIACANRYKYKPSVMPTGRGELTKKQIKRDFTN